MWALDNQTPYAADRTWIRDKRGGHAWVVAVKATYDLRENGPLKLADDQLPVLLEPEYTGKPGQSSLRYEADLIPPKSTTDVLVNASAHAPGGRPVKMLGVSIRVGPVQKKLAVFGTRIYNRGLTGIALSSPAEFSHRPLVYEWAFGGTDTQDPDPKHHLMDARNPVGRGYVARDKHLLDLPGHSVEYLRGDPRKVGPAGFGPIASYWSPRRELAGTYDSSWEKTRKPLLPMDYDPQHLQCAPVDQRPPVPLQGGEPVELLHLSPRPVLQFALPRVELSFATSIGRKVSDHPGKLTTVCIEPNANRVILVWQSSLQVPATQVDQLDQTTIRVRHEDST